MITIQSVHNKSLKKRKNNNRHWTIFLLLIPGLLWYIIFKYIPMIGSLTAFTNFGRAAEIDFIGLDNFTRAFRTPGFWRAFKNTLIISFMSIGLSFPIPISLAILINEAGSKRFKKSVQFFSYLPHFFSWVVVGSIFTMLLSPNNGIINNILLTLGVEDPIFFMASNKWYRYVLVLMQVWKNTGYSAVIYIAALAGIEQQLYEAAKIDGASYFKQAIYITLPALRNTIMTVLLLTVARILLVFEPILITYNPAIYETADVLQTYIYRVGLVSGDMGFAAAVGLFTSVTSGLLVVGCNQFNKKVFNEKII